MDEYWVEVDEPLADTLTRVRAWLDAHPDPPWLDLGDRIVWFDDASHRARFLARDEDGRRRMMCWLPMLGWWNGSLLLVVGRDPPLDQAQHGLLVALAREVPVRLLGPGPVDLDELVDPERYLGGPGQA